MDGEPWGLLLLILLLLPRDGPSRPPRYRQIDGRGEGWTTSRDAQRQHLAHFGWGRRGAR